MTLCPTQPDTLINKPIKLVSQDVHHSELKRTHYINDVLIINESTHSPMYTHGHILVVKSIDPHQVLVVHKWNPSHSEVLLYVAFYLVNQFPPVPWQMAVD
jgi:hypothetical protein